MSKRRFRWAEKCMAEKLCWVRVDQFQQFCSVAVYWCCFVYLWQISFSYKGNEPSLQVENLINEWEGRWWLSGMTTAGACEFEDFIPSGRLVGWMFGIAGEEKTCWAIFPMRGFFWGAFQLVELFWKKTSHSFFGGLLNKCWSLIYL